ncbi:lig_chan-Glu_bd domain-containing protein [Trichonephila inaurata madagascariensis]|uniref:Lig_chan-Glu_bd domain-containing protein n=1 Tax=Trichonephila inaurata madagascariensis TaxID=2747483 RepID=A0A8X6XYQ8_9ARAC|nr:lig_chan-Glu_bd domain-containing protein [Trichonephila inaurata madagascariensis]
MKIPYFPNKLKVAAVKLKTLFYIENIKNKIVLGGIDGKLLDCLAKKLNFEFEILSTHTGGSRHSNGTWDGVIGLVRNGEADIGLGCLVFSQERFEVVDFSKSYSALEKIFAAKEPGQVPKITAFTYPFTQNVWIFYTLMILAATVLFQRIMFRNATLLGSFLSVLGSIVTKGMENVKDTPWRRVLFGLWLTIATVMPFLYNTCFLSFLTMPEKMPIPKTFKELSDTVLNGKYKCLVPKEAIDVDLLLGSGIDHLVKLGETIQKNHWKFSYAERLEHLLDDTTAVIIPKFALELLLGSPPYIKVKKSGDYSGIWHSGIALKKGFCCRKRLNDVLNGIINGGLYEKWINDVSFAETIRKRLELKHEEPQLQLTLEDLKLAFSTLCFGYAMAFLAFLGEVLIPKSVDIFYY